MSCAYTQSGHIDVINSFDFVLVCSQIRKRWCNQHPAQANTRLRGDFIRDPQKVHAQSCESYQIPSTAFIQPSQPGLKILEGTALEHWGSSLSLEFFLALSKSSARFGSDMCYLRLPPKPLHTWPVAWVWPQLQPRAIPDGGKDRFSASRASRSPKARWWIEWGSSTSMMRSYLGESWPCWSHPRAEILPTFWGGSDI